MNINPVRVDVVKPQHQKKREVEEQVQQQNNVQNQQNLNVQPANEENEQVQEAEQVQNNQQQVTLNQILALVQQIEREPDADKRNQMADQAIQLIDQMQAQLENPDQDQEAIQANNHGQGKALGKDNRINHLAERAEEGKKLANGHIKQLERLGQSGSPELQIRVLDALEARVNAARDKDPGMRALEIMANNNKLALQVRNQPAEQPPAEEPAQAQEVAAAPVADQAAAEEPQVPIPQVEQIAA